MMFPTDLFMSIRSKAGTVCIASAMLLVSQMMESAAFFSQTASTRNAFRFEPPVFDFAHSVPVQRNQYASSAPLRVKPNRMQENAIRQPWYRYALPLSLAVFFLSFSLWALQSQSNFAIRPLSCYTEGAATPASSNEDSGTRPTSVCQHATEELGFLPSLLLLDPSH
jgi:hypothetical protein